jgi:hypothetical protein
LDRNTNKLLAFGSPLQAADYIGISEIDTWGQWSQEVIPWKSLAPRKFLNQAHGSKKERKILSILRGTYNDITKSGLLSHFFF